jgi:hypothetical protein
MTNKKTGGRTAADAPITSRSVPMAILKHNFCLGVKRLNKKKRNIRYRQVVRV